jgi:hypothetical protein
MDHAPDPAYGRTDEALLEIAPHELEKQAAPFHQVLQEQCTGNAKGMRQRKRYQESSATRSFSNWRRAISAQFPVLSIFKYAFQ